MFYLIYGMVFAGSALMVYNIYTYIKYLRHIQGKGYWDSGQFMLKFPLVLLIGFLAGYLVVGLIGKPDIVMSGILFFGSVYVTIILAVLKSITQRIEENEKLKSDLQAAEEANRAKSSFLSNMSHEIRTPMNAIIGLNTLALRNPDLPPETRQQLEKMEVSEQHMMDLINDILDMSRIESGRAELRWEPFLIHDLTRQVNGIIQSQCDDKGLNYVFDTASPLEEAYLGDIVKLKQMLINLLGNSVKFTPAGGTVRLTILEGLRKGELRPLKFIVSDTGIGIDPEFLPHLFDSFSMEDESATNRYGGTGLGMAITKGLVDMMDGEIQVNSEKDRGTIFTINVTLKAVDAQSAQRLVEQRLAQQAQIDRAEEAAENKNNTAWGSVAGTAAGAAPDTGKAGGTGEVPGAPATSAPAFIQDTSTSDPLEGKHILYAEDVEINAEILGDLLEMEGMTSDWAKNGQEAVEKFSGSPAGTYDAILMDLRMPVMDGLTAARTIRAMDREDAKAIPIIALTANAFSEDAQECSRAGMDAHLSKPINSDLLCGELRRLTGNGENDG